MREVLHAAPVAIIAIDTAGLVVEANAEAVTLCAPAGGDLLGSPVVDILPELGSAPHALTVLRCGDGQRRTVEVRRSAVGDLTVVAIIDASERFEVTAALHARRQMIGAAVERADLTVVLDATGVVTAVSGPLADQIGAEIVGRSWRDFVHAEHLEPVAEALRRLPTEGPDVRTMEVLIESEGERLWADALVYVERAEDGGARSYVVLLKDVTARRDAEETLRRSERQLHDAFNWSAAGLAIGEDGRLVRVNRALTQLLGRPEDELLGRDLIDFTHPDDRELTVQARGAERPVEYEKRYVRPDGSIAWGLVGGAVIRDDEGRISHYVGSIVDITALKQSEDELARRSAKQAAIIELGRRALAGVAGEELDDLALLVVAQHLPVELAALLEVGGADDGLLVRRSRGWDPDPTGRRVPVGTAPAGYALETGQSVVVDDLEREERFASTPLLVEAGIRSSIASPIYVDGAVAGVLTVHGRTPCRFSEDDVMFVQSIAAVVGSAMARERHEAIAERARQQDRLAVVGQMAAGLAHDFNNVLTVVKLHAELLRREPTLSEDGRRHTGTISEQVDRAIALVWQLLDVARRGDVQVEPVDLATFVDQLVPVVERSLPAGSTVDVVVERRPSTVLADMSRLNQIVLNLVSNARDAMPRGGRLTLSLTHRSDGGRAGCVLEVRDSGVGMPPDVERRAFDPFFSTKGPGQGTGLGLPQVRALVDQHEGHVTLHTSPGGGTAVRIWLPAPASPADDPPAPASAQESRDRGRGEHVLVVEDEAAVAGAVTAQLQDLGYVVVHAANGREALDLVAGEDELAVVLTDLAMPELDGEELARRLRRDRPRLPVVLTGARPVTDPDLRDLVWLQKPYSRERLARVIADAVATR